MPEWRPLTETGSLPKPGPTGAPPQPTLRAQPGGPESEQALAVAPASVFRPCRMLS